jgi:hypothetical protein
LERFHRICRKPRLKPGSYQAEICEDTNLTRVTVVIGFETEFTIFFGPRKEQVVLRNDFNTLDL